MGDMPNNDSSSKKGNATEAAKLRSVGQPPQTEEAGGGLLTRAEVAARLKVCGHTIQRLTRRGLLPAIIFNSRLIRYTPNSVETYIRAAATVGKRGAI